MVGVMPFNGSLAKHKDTWGQAETDKTNDTDILAGIHDTNGTPAQLLICSIGWILRKESPQTQPQCLQGLSTNTSAGPGKSPFIVGLYIEIPPMGRTWQTTDASCDKTTEYITTKSGVQLWLIGGCQLQQSLYLKPTESQLKPSRYVCLFRNLVCLVCRFVSCRMHSPHKSQVSILWNVPLGHLCSGLVGILELLCQCKETSVLAVAILIQPEGSQYYSLCFTAQGFSGDGGAKT